MAIYRHNQDPGTGSRAPLPCISLTGALIKAARISLVNNKPRRPGTGCSLVIITYAESNFSLVIRLLFI